MPLKKFKINDDALKIKRNGPAKTFMNRSIKSYVKWAPLRMTLKKILAYMVTGQKKQK